MRSTVANRVISPILIVTHCPTGLTPGMKDSLYGTGQDSSSLCSAVTSPAHLHPSCGAHKPSAIRLPRQTLHQVSSCAFQGLGSIPVGILSPTKSPRPTAQLPALMAEDTQTQHRAAVGSQSAVAVGEHPDWQRLVLWRHYSHGKHPAAHAHPHVVSATPHSSWAVFPIYDSPEEESGFNCTTSETTRSDSAKHGHYQHPSLLPCFCETGEPFWATFQAWSWLKLKRSIFTIFLLRSSWQKHSTKYVSPPVINHN